MNTYNTSRAIPVEQIGNFSVAAHEFAEGNTNLETLLLNLHSKGIESIACCAGHKEKNQLPYIAIRYNEYNLSYLFAIFSILKDKGYMLGFSKSPARSFVNIHENEFFPIYQLKTKDRMEAFLSLKYIYENTYLPKEEITDNKGKYR